MTLDTDTQLIRACIHACVEAKDGRGRWRPMQALHAALQPAMQASDVIARATANAAGNFGGWLAAWIPKA